MIYLAAPLFTPSERRFNTELADALGLIDNVFLPQRDGLLLTDLVKAGTSVAEAEALVFQRDINAISHCNLLVAVLDGANVDEGVAFEIGVAFARGIHSIGLQTDCRRQLPTGNNPMISQALKEIFQSDSQLLKWCNEHYPELLIQQLPKDEHSPQEYKRL